MCRVFEVLVEHVFPWDQWENWPVSVAKLVVYTMCAALAVRQWVSPTVLLGPDNEGYLQHEMPT